MRRLISAILLSLFLLPVNLAFAEGEAGEDQGETGAGLLFIEFDPFSISIIQRTRVAGFLSVAFHLAVEDEETVLEVERLRPKLSDAVVRILSRVASSRLDVNRPVEVSLIQAYIQMAVDNIIGAGKARVLMQIVSLQPA